MRNHAVTRRAIGVATPPFTLAEEGDGAVKTRTLCKSKCQRAALSPDPGEPPKRRQPPSNHNLKKQELRQQFEVQGGCALPRELEGRGGPRKHPRSLPIYVCRRPLAPRPDGRVTPLIPCGRGGSRDLVFPTRAYRCRDTLRR